MLSANELPTAFHPHEIFPRRDRLAGITAEDVSPEIAEMLNLPLKKSALDDGWTEPERLTEALPEVAAFDLDLLPDSMRPLVKDIAERMQVPVDFPAICVIATLAGVTNRRARIQPKINDGSWKVVPNLWGGIVAPPGMMKSPVISAVTQIAAAIESEWRKAYDDAERDYQRAADEEKLRESAWKDNVQGRAEKPG